MLGQRQRRCTDIVQMLYKCFVFPGSAADLHIHPRSRHAKSKRNALFRARMTFGIP